jgi:hypothetical protein
MHPIHNCTYIRKNNKTASNKSYWLSTTSLILNTLEILNNKYYETDIRMRKSTINYFDYGNMYILGMGKKHRFYRSIHRYFNIDDLFSINSLNIHVYIQIVRIFFFCIILVCSIQKLLYSIHCTVIIRARKFMH